MPHDGKKAASGARVAPPATWPAGPPKPWASRARVPPRPTWATMSAIRAPARKLAQRRLTVLEPAERLGNVTEACRRGGIDRTSI